jgi:hypothetical protein
MSLSRDLHDLLTANDKDDDDENLLSERDPEIDGEPRLGCLFPGQCCMPGEHMTDECHTAEMLMQQEHALEIEGYLKQIEGYKEQIEDLEYALKNIYDGTLARPQDLDIGYKSQEILASIVKTTHFSAKVALDKSDRTSIAR